MKKIDIQREMLVDYFRRGEKARGEEKIGVEFEQFVIHRDSLKSVSFYGSGGVEESLRDIGENGWKEEVEEGHVVGLYKKPYTVSTEPAAQFEVSVDARKEISVLEREYVNFFKEVLPVFHGKDQDLVALGYQPLTKIDEIKISPKKRYDYMYNHFKKTGTHAHNMMKGTAAVQVTIDYFNQEDFVKKYRIGNSLSPIFYNLFDNAYIFQGERADFHNVRQHIWENTDSERSGIPKFAFDQDMSYAKYADYILNNDIIFEAFDGKLKGTEGRSFAEIFDPEIHGDDEIYHALSIVFPDLRLKHYLEFRMMDSVPYPMNFAIVALIKGLFYSEENLETLSTYFKDMTYEDMMLGKAEGMSKGIQGIYKSRSYLDWGKELYRLAETGLAEDERPYLLPIKKILDSGKTLRDLFGEILEKDGLKAAVELMRIEVDNV